MSAAAPAIAPQSRPATLSVSQAELLSRIEDAEQAYAELLVPSPQLDRKLVSFQANKADAIFRLFKYKEGFSAALVAYFLDNLDLDTGPVLDPFSGTGTTSIVCASRGIASTGIELLPIGNLIAQARYEILHGLSATTKQNLRYWLEKTPWHKSKQHSSLLTYKITAGAYPESTLHSIEQYLGLLADQPPQTQTLLQFALCSILEEVSYTRKDGQFLRWDYRSGRRAGKNPFNKGEIRAFDTAIQNKLTQILADAESPGKPDLFASTTGEASRAIELIAGTCLTELAQLPSNHYQAIITSPPYCNRYDYTRTYALELAALGVTEPELSELRQTMLSCTIENRQKDLLDLNPAWVEVLNYCSDHAILAGINDYFLELKHTKQLNNSGIPRMIAGYFNEMACVIHEAARVLKPGGYMLTVNDNVRYAGISIPVDVILSDIAAYCGLEVVKIMVLPTGKGNSSQQMGVHGRAKLRKCVYLWRKRGELTGKSAKQLKLN